MNKLEVDKPNKEDDKYQMFDLTEKKNGVTSIPFDHVSYESDLEDYIEQLRKERDEFKTSLGMTEESDIGRTEYIEELEQQLQAEKQKNEELRELVEKIYSSTNVYENKVDAVRRIQYDISQHSKLNK